ncbi:MAG TPA: SPOR domain-containing protein [Terriglobales bacterium]|nr:SPOR domain-containing protein [Terriglobales bacterium]
MAENRRGKRFYFSRGQLFLLGVGFTAAAVIIFLLGMMVGKGIEEGKLSKTAPPAAKIPVNPSAQDSNAAPGAAAKEEMTFYDTLTKTPDAPLPGDKKHQETKRPDKTTEAHSKESTVNEDSRPAKKAENKEAETAGKTSSTDTLKETKASPSWTVQVNAVPDENSAKIWVDRLKNKGYNAYVTEVRTQGKIWYRVRVGHYHTRAEAEKTEEALRSKENFTKAFATSQ